MGRGTPLGESLSVRFSLFNSLELAADRLSENTR